MRTDAKIGFAIGAVLLAVLTVYAIVVPKKRTASPQGVKIVAQNLPSNSKPSPDVVVVDKPSTPIPDVVPPAPKADPMPAPAPTPGPVASNDPKPNDGGVNWDKLVGPTSTLYSANPTNNSTATSTDPAPSNATTVLTPPPADTSTFTPGADTAVNAKPSRILIGATSEGTVHTKATPTHKTGRSHSTEVASTEKPASARTSSEKSAQYVVEAGDTLSGIAAEHYGASHYYVAILKANPSLNPNRMRPGTKISLPDLGSAVAAKSGETTVADLQSPRTHFNVEGAAGGGVFTPGSSPDTLFATTGSSHSTADSTYTVHAGDNLYRISKKLYGTAKMAHEIFVTNQDVIGSDMSKLKLGMVLTLPESPLQ